jgi:hypothetical protein
MLPHDGVPAKRATKTKRYQKERAMAAKHVEDREMYEHSERLTPTARRIYEYMKARALGGDFPMGQAAIAKQLKVPMPTCKAAFAQLQEKRFIARKRSNVYALNPERSYRGPEEQLSLAKTQFAELVEAYKKRVACRPPMPPKAKRPGRKTDDGGELFVVKLSREEVELIRLLEARMGESASEILRQGLHEYAGATGYGREGEEKTTEVWADVELGF